MDRQERGARRTVSVWDGYRVVDQRGRRCRLAVFNRSMDAPNAVGAYRGDGEGNPRPHGLNQVAPDVMSW